MRVAIFVATNHAVRPIRYSVCIEQKTNSAWPIYYGPLPHQGYYDVPAGQDFSLAAVVPAGPTPWRISVCYSVMDSRLGKMRWRIADYLYNRGFDKLGRLIHEGAIGCFAVGAEMTNDAKVSISEH
jgi:hypothetical protein